MLTDAARYSSFGWVQTVQTCSDRSDMILERLERFWGLSHLAITDAQLRLHLSSPVHVDLPDLRWVKAIHKNHKNHKKIKGSSCSHLQTFRILQGHGMYTYRWIHIA